jgi:hypothetical protein
MKAERRERELERVYPEIEWREPVEVRRFGERRQHFACRFCIAIKGLKGEQISALATDRAAVLAHIQQEHL